MLEQRSLLLRPRREGARQTIADADTGSALGFVSWSKAPASPWWRCLLRWELAVHEQEDEPLLFTIHRPGWLLGRLQIRDADGHPVGVVLGRRILDRFGYPLAQLSAKNSQGGIFRAADQRALAEMDRGPEGLRLVFGPEVATDPFAKMLLLAVVVVAAL
jgi:hypothetical protein